MNEMSESVFYVSVIRKTSSIMWIMADPLFILKIGMILTSWYYFVTLATISYTLNQIIGDERNAKFTLIKYMEKYRAKKNEIDWIKFSSLLEGRFYKYFRDNSIEIIELQPRYELQSWFRYQGKAIRKIEYVADFLIRYEWDIFVVDAKWMSVPVFAIKYKLWLRKFWSENILIIAKSIKDLEKQLKIN